MPSTALAESESPRGGDIKAVSEAEERTEESASEESTPTEEVKAEETERVDAEEQEEGTSEGDTQEEESKPVTFFIDLPPFVSFVIPVKIRSSRRNK